MFLFLFSPAQQRLAQLEEAARAAGKGKHAEGESTKHVRDIKWVIDNPRHFVDSHHNKPIDGMFPPYHVLTYQVFE